MFLDKPLSQMTYDELMHLMGEALQTPQLSREFIALAEREPNLFERFDLGQELYLAQAYGELINRSMQETQEKR